MASLVPSTFYPGVNPETTPLLLVGSGGIGCEALKTLVYSGFKRISIIDMDTVEVSNLNRQFLFHKQHVGQSKAKTAKASIEAMRAGDPSLHLTAYHANLMDSTFGIEFYKKFSVVISALDNIHARRHLNRMCLSSHVPLIESGTAGYLGQVTHIIKGQTECFECKPLPQQQKTFPICTIRNTPSEPIHCVVWAKHVFNALFGQSENNADLDSDHDQAQNGLENSILSLRKLLMDSHFDAERIFDRLFVEDIHDLLKLDDLWKPPRKRPVPLDPASEFSKALLSKDHSYTLRLKDPTEASSSMALEEFSHYVHLFLTTLDNLTNKYKADLLNRTALVWDKDNDLFMNFVGAASNLRAHIFKIEMKPIFELKSMAGNIIPAIASTNAVVAGLIVLDIFKLLSLAQDPDSGPKLKTTYLSRTPNGRGRLLVLESASKANPSCYVCQSASIDLLFSPDQMRLTDLEIFLQRHLGLSEVYVTWIVDGQYKEILSPDLFDDADADTDAGDLKKQYMSKRLSDFGSCDAGCVLQCEDGVQRLSMNLNFKPHIFPDFSAVPLSVCLEKEFTLPPTEEINSTEHKEPHASPLNTSKTNDRNDHMEDVAIITSPPSNHRKKHKPN